MTDSIAADLHRATTWSIVFSVLMIMAGIAAIGLPLVAGVTVAVILGWLLIFCGLLHVAFAWQGGKTGLVIWEVLLGLLYGAIGFYLLVRPVAVLVSLTLAVAAYLVIKGVLEFVRSLRLRHVPGSGWVMVDGVVSLVLAIMIWSTWPSSAIWVVGTLVGVSMFVSGVTRLMLSLAARRIAA